MRNTSRLVHAQLVPIEVDSMNPGQVFARFPVLYWPSLIANMMARESLITLQSRHPPLFFEA